jgi:GNAT superfamily N-acetyltransferase
MALTVLPSTFAPSSADLVRLFHQSQLEWSRHLGEETGLDFGRWVSNPSLANNRDANCLHDAFVLPDLPAEPVIATMQERADRAGLPWRSCSLSSSMPTVGLADALLRGGWTAAPLTIFYRRKHIVLSPRSDLNLTIIPSRASYRHYSQLQGDSAEAAILHLDDSHLDSLLALRGGDPVGCVGVLTSGEFGTLRDWSVAEAYRGKGSGRVLLDRALEICTRGLLKHVMLGLSADAKIARGLIQEAGFEEIGKWDAYAR